MGSAGLGKQGRRNVLLVPIAFTSDHIETLYELDIEYGHKAKEVRLSATVTGGHGRGAVRSNPCSAHRGGRQGLRPKQWGVTNLRRAASLNDSPAFIECLTALMAEHLRGEYPASRQLGYRCPGCTNSRCAETKRFFDGPSRA